MLIIPVQETHLENHCVMVKWAFEINPVIVYSKLQATDMHKLSFRIYAARC